MRFTWLTSLTLLFLFLPGCARSIHRLDLANSVTTAVLFDAAPGRPTASDMASRQVWPATDAYQQSRQIIVFRERFIDLQGPHSFGRRHDSVYRRTETRREIRAHR